MTFGCHCQLLLWTFTVDPLDGRIFSVPVFAKVAQLVTRVLMAVRRNKKINKSKITALSCFDNLKKKQQNQGTKNWCYTERFMSLTISNIRTTAFYFENIKLLK